MKVSGSVLAIILGFFHSQFGSYKHYSLFYFAAGAQVGDWMATLKLQEIKTINAEWQRLQVTHWFNTKSY